MAKNWVLQKQRSKVISLTTGLQIKGNRVFWFLIEVLKRRCHSQGFVSFLQVFVINMCFYLADTKGVFITQSNIYDGAFL